MTRTIALALLMALWGGASMGCSSPDAESRAGGAPGRSATELPDPNGRNLPELGEPLMLALAQAKNHHHKADVFLGEGQIERAVDAVEQILAIPFPEDAPEAEDVTLDARARLAKLLVAQGRIDRAMEVVDQGIAGSVRRSFFVANLYTVKGEVYEAMANTLDEEDTDTAREQARAARRNAIEAFDQSIAINSELQQALMLEGTP